MAAEGAGVAAEPRGPSVGVRLLLALGGLLVGAYYVSYAVAVLEAGYPFTSAVVVVVAFPFAAMLLAIAAFPRAAGRVLDRLLRLDLSDPGHVTAFLLISGACFIVFGPGSLVEGAFGYERVALQGKPLLDSGDVGEADVLAGVLLNLLVFIAPVVAWVALVGRVPLSRVASELGLRAEGAGVAFAQGVGLTLAVLAVIAVAAALAERSGFAAPENDRAVAIAAALSIPAAVLVSAGAAISEEVFFRGFLTPRVGVLGQAVLFSLAHISYVNALQLVVTFALGFAYGWIFQRGRNLWAPVAAHFSFNLLMLLSAQFAGVAGRIPY